MGGKFHPDDLKNPLYEHSQVVTNAELIAIYNGLAQQYHCTPWWRFKLRWGLKASGGAIYELVTWLRQGKPTMTDIGDLK